MVNIFRKSLEAKILGVVMLVLIIGFGLFSIYDIREISQALRTQKEQSTAGLSTEVVQSIQNTMLAKAGLGQEPDAADVSRRATAAVNNLRQNPQVTDIQVFGFEGQGVFGTDEGDQIAGDMVENVFATGVGESFYEGSGDDELRVDVRPLVNEASCQECHMGEGALRGVVLVSSSMNEVNSEISAQKVRMGVVFFSGLAILLIVLTISLRVAILKPMRTMVGVITKIASGDLDKRVEIDSGDEVGYLAENFNAMTDSLQKTQDNLRTANLNLLEANRLKSEFLSVMSHELRTPLNAIIGFSEVLQDFGNGEIDAREEKYLTNIETSGRHLLQLVNDILDLAKVGSDSLELHLEDVSIPHVMEDIRKLGHPFAAQRRQLLQVVHPEPLPLVKADPAKIKRVLYNLVSNAIKFTPEGGQVTLSAEQRGGFVEISVTDNGIGISEEDQGKIFTLFGQLDSSHTREHEGTGVGLVLSKKLVELHRGDIRVESTLGKGSKFTFSLPLDASRRREQDAIPVEGDLQPIVDSAQGDDQQLILVVEDDPQTSELISIWLKEASYSVARAFDGEQALELARELKPYAITLDILLPKIDGWEVLQELKADPETESIPVIIVSILEKTRRGLEMGAFDYFIKPVEKNELLCRLESRRLFNETLRN